MFLDRPAGPDPTVVFVCEQARVGLLDRVDVQHLQAALLHERARRRHVLPHFLDEDVSGRLVVLHAGRQVQGAFRVQDRDRIAGLGARRGARAVCGAVVASFRKIIVGCVPSM